MNISRKLAKKAIAVASATMLMGSAISVCASEPVQSIAVESNQTINGLSKDFLLNYYTNHFDVEAYKKANPDLVSVLGNDNQAYINHYVNNGISEGRRTGTFDPVAFIVNNYDYYMEHGLDGNFPYFNVDAYKKANPDLVPVLGNNPLAYLEHYLTCGITEGRVSGGSFDPVVFAKKYPNADIRTNAAPIDLRKAEKAEQFKADVKK